MVDLFGIRRRRRRREAFTRVAAALGGTHHLPSGMFRRQNERIEAVVAQVPVVLEIYYVSAGQSAHPYTRVYAPFLHGPGIRHKVYREGVLASVGKTIGTQDVTLGEPAFDATFMVKADSAAIARRLWSEASMRQMVDRFAKANLTATVEAISLVESGFWDEADRLHSGIGFVAELAARDLYGAEALRAVDGGRFIAPAGEPPYLELDTPVRVEIRAEDVDGRLAMVARASERCELEPVVLEIVDGRPTEPERASRWPQGAHVALRTVGTGVLAIEPDALRFSWRELELDPRRLRAGSELLGAIAAERASVYR